MGLPHFSKVQLGCAALLAACVSGCFGDAALPAVDGGSGGGLGSGGGSASGGGVATGGGTATGGSNGQGGGGATGGDTGTGGGQSSVYDIPSGTLLFAESFEDANLSGRGWFDGPAAMLANDASPGDGSHSFQCQFNQGGTACAGGQPSRHKHTATDRVFVSMQLKFSSNWVGSGRAYHPHMFHFTTNKDSDYVGPASSHLTTYIEILNAKALLALTDTLNVDGNCVFLNNDSFIGCNGNFTTYSFTEARSVASCNGIVGDLDVRDCFDNGGEWYSARTWFSPAWFTDSAGPQYKGDWHHLEAYFQMNTLQAGKGVADGKLRLWLDGQKLISKDAVLFRTGINGDQVFTEFLVLPYIGDGSPVQQSFFVDALKVATGYVP